MNLTAKRAIAALAIFSATAAFAQAAPEDAKRAKDRLTGDAKMKAADNPQCRLFTPAEAGKYIGKPVKAGENAAGANGCQWAARDDDGDVMVQIVPSRYYEAATLAKGFRKLPEVGTKGYVVPEMGGWKAGTVVGDSFVVVSVAGGTASEAAAVALLQEALKRHKP
jgi:hypothetical protein